MWFGNGNSSSDDNEKQPPSESCPNSLIFEEQWFDFAADNDAAATADALATIEAPTTATNDIVDQALLDQVGFGLEEWDSAVEDEEDDRMDEEEEDVLLEEPEAPPPLNRNLSFGLSGLLDAMRRSATSGSSLLTSTSVALSPTPPVRRKRRRRRRRSPPIVAGPPALLAPKTSDDSGSGIKNDSRVLEEPRSPPIEDVPLAPKYPQPPPPPQQQPRPVPKKTLAQLQLSCSPKNKDAAAVTTGGTNRPPTAPTKPATARDLRPMRNMRSKKKKTKQAPQKKKNKTKPPLRRSRSSRRQNIDDDELVEPVELTSKDNEPSPKRSRRATATLERSHRLMDDWQRTFVDFLQQPSEHLDLLTGNPLPRNKLLIWAKQKRPPRTHRLDDGPPCPETTNATTTTMVNLIRINKTGTAVRFEEDDDDQKKASLFGEWIRQQRCHYNELVLSAPANEQQQQQQPPEGGAAAAPPPSLPPTMQQFKRAQKEMSKAAFQEMMDGQFDRVRGHFRLNLLQMVGVDLDLAPDLTLVQRPHISRARLAVRNDNSAARAEAMPANNEEEHNEAMDNDGDDSTVTEVSTVRAPALPTNEEDHNEAMDDDGDDSTVTQVSMALPANEEEHEALDDDAGDDSTVTEVSMGEKAMEAV